jgi:hypothetical protein
MWCYLLAITILLLGPTSEPLDLYKGGILDRGISLSGAKKRKSSHAHCASRRSCKEGQALLHMWIEHSNLFLRIFLYTKEERLTWNKIGMCHEETLKIQFQ